MTDFTFTAEQQDKIAGSFGRDFLSSLPRRLRRLSQAWGLTGLSLVESYSANLVFTCVSDMYGRSVLKLGRPSSEELGYEYSALSDYGGGRFCRVHCADLSDPALLEERIFPGNTLRDEPSVEKRLGVFLSLYKGLHIHPKTGAYPSYIGWVKRITGWMAAHGGRPVLLAHMERARDICLSLSRKYDQEMLLHGDFHHDNILSCGGGYKIIDPKGVVGDPVFDLPRYILNEFEDEHGQSEYNKIEMIINAMSSELGVPDSVIRRCLYVETAMSVCWCVESGASAEDYPAQLENVRFAESMLK